jgi:hypothetical protein
MYKSDFIIDKDILDEIYEEMVQIISPRFPARVTSSSPNEPRGVVNYDHRKVVQHACHPNIYPEFCEQLNNFVDDGTKVNQLDLLRYRTGDFFGVHQDGGEHHNRVWSTITVIHYSEDYEGGGLVLYDNDPHKNSGHVETPIPLEVGQTAIFNSNIFHEAKPVVKGERWVIVAWLGT